MISLGLHIGELRPAPSLDLHAHAVEVCML